LKSTDSFEILQSSAKGKKSTTLKRDKFQIISNDVEIDENMIQEFKNRSNDFKTDYLVFGIIGTQSTGKSTLLNFLFNCEFQMLDAKKGRRQTTKGIWGSFIDEKRMLVLDIEGSDSMERSLRDQNAENKICTFGLLMTHVLLSSFSFFM
jgi:ribosome biogenesis GTPase A